MQMIPNYNKRTFNSECDKDFLSRIKPKKIIMDKEQLYQENLELKMKVHYLSEELLRIRTKMMQQESELLKREDSQKITDKSKNGNLIQGLKQSIKELKAEKVFREQEIFKLKSNLKGSKVNELEIEVKAYIDECTRLRHHLEELIKSKQEQPEQQVNFQQVFQTLKYENAGLAEQLNQARMENNKLSVELEEQKKKKKTVVKKIDVNNRSEVQKIKSLMEIRNKEFMEKEERFKSEIIALKNKLEIASVKVKQKPQFLLNIKPKAPKLFKIINSIIPKNFKTITDVTLVLKNTKTINSIYEALKIHYSNVKVKHIVDVINYFNLLHPEKIVDVLKEWFLLFDYTGNDEDSEEEKKKPKVNPVVVFNSIENIDNIQISPLVPRFEAIDDEEIKPIHNPKNELIKEVPVEKSKKTKPLPIPNIKSSTPDLHQTNEEIKSIPPKKLLSIPPPIIIPEAVPLSTKKSQLIPLTLIKIPSSSPSPHQILPVKLEAVKDLLLRISLTLQVHRLSRSEFSKSIGAIDPIYLPKLQKFFENDPFKFTSSESLLVSTYLMEPTEESYGEAIEHSTLSCIQLKFEKSCNDWEIFTEVEIENLEIQLQDLISIHKNSLQEAFILRDTDDDGMVTFDEFVEVMAELSLEPSKKILDYCKLLFYSYNMQINSVPYSYFLQSYGNNEHSFSFNMSDEEIAWIVKECLGKIAGKLKSAQVSALDIFEQDNEGLISFKKMKRGLEKLEIDDINDDQINLLFDALQYEETNQIGILIDEFDEILTQYALTAGSEEFPSSRGFLHRKESELQPIKSEENYSEDYESDFSEN